MPKSQLELLSHEILQQQELHRQLSTVFIVSTAKEAQSVQQEVNSQGVPVCAYFSCSFSEYQQRFEFVLECIYFRKFQTCYSNPMSNAHTGCNKRSGASVRRLFVQFFPQRKFLLSITLLPSAEEIVGGSRGNSQKFSETRFNFYQFAPICGKKTSARVVHRQKHSWQMNRYKRVVINLF